MPSTVPPSSHPLPHPAYECLPQCLPRLLHPLLQSPGPELGQDPLAVIGWEETRDLPAVQQAIDVLHEGLAQDVVVGEQERNALAIAPARPAAGPGSVNRNAARLPSHPHALWQDQGRVEPRVRMGLHGSHRSRFMVAVAFSELPPASLSASPHSPLPLSLAQHHDTV